MPKIATKRSIACTLTVPNFLPPLLNQFTDRHWAVRSRIKREAKAVFAAYAIVCRIPPATGRRRVTLAVTLTKGQRRPDVDGYWKVTLDALVACKLLKGDGPKWCEILPVVYRRGAETKTEVTLEDI